MRNKNQSGFTLIELLVVIAIIGLLASVVLLALNGARAKARDAKRIADVRQLASAFELFYNDFNSYPSAVTAGIPNYIAPNYIGLWPTSPTPSDCPSGTAGGVTNAYNYLPGYNAGGALSSSTYALTFCLGGVTGGYSAGGHTLSQSGIQ